MPHLDPAALQKQIALRRLGPLYLLIGDDVRRIEQLLDEIESTIDAADRPFAVDRLYAAEGGGAPVDIVSTARVFPMLGDRRIVIVMRAERLLKPKRASKAAEIEDIDTVGEEPAAIDLSALEEYVDKPVASTSVVFVATDVDRSRRFTKRLVEKAQVVEFSGLDADTPQERRDLKRAAAVELREQIERAGRTIDPKVLEMLVDRAAGDISKLRGDVERLLLYTEGQTRISRDDVDEIAAVESTVEDDWAVVNAIADGKPALALRETGYRLDRGDSPHMLVGQLRWWVSERLSQSAPERVKPALEALFRTDLALKSSGGDERVLIERLIVELAG